MTFRQFAVNNVLRNKRIYAAYFLASIFSVMVFFTFSIFAFHPRLTGNTFVTLGMNVSAGIIFVFSFFFILYSMSSFLHSRKKEFGLLITQGMSMKQIRSMTFLENMFIGLFATIGGIGLGLVFAKAILLIAENIFIMDTELPFYLPTQAIVLAFSSFMILFFLISLFVSRILRSHKLIDLIKADKKSKGEPKASVFLTIIAVILLGVGYTTAVLAIGRQVLLVMLPTVLVVIIGTYLLFTQLNVFVIRRLKRKEKFFWHKTNMIVLSDLSFRMKDNARTFFLVAIISTVAFSAIGTLYGFQTFLTDAIEQVNPNSLTYRDNNTGKEEANILLIDKTLKEANVKTNKKEIKLHYYTLSDEAKVLIAKESDYNQLADLSNRERIVVKDGAPVLADPQMMFHAQKDEADRLSNAVKELKEGSVLEPVKLTDSNLLLTRSQYYIVSDSDFDSLPAPAEEENYYVWQETGDKNIPLKTAKNLDEELNKAGLNISSYNTYMSNKAYGLFLFVGFFIGIVFFVAAGGFLYFRLYSDLDDDIQKFQAITKIGLTEKELKKVLNRQIMILFFAPIVVALIHGAVALTALANLFYYNLLKESAIILSVFLAIQIIYFFVVRFYYIRQIKTALR